VGGVFVKCKAGMGFEPKRRNQAIVAQFWARHVNSN